MSFLAKSGKSVGYNDKTGVEEEIPKAVFSAGKFATEEGKSTKEVLLSMHRAEAYGKLTSWFDQGLANLFMTTDGATGTDPIELLKEQSGGKSTSQVQRIWGNGKENNAQKTEALGTASVDVADQGQNAQPIVPLQINKAGDVNTSSTNVTNVTGNGGHTDALLNGG